MSARQDQRKKSKKRPKPKRTPQETAANPLGQALARRPGAPLRDVTAGRSTGPVEAETGESSALRLTSTSPERRGRPEGKLLAQSSRSARNGRDRSAALGNAFLRPTQP
ncbi:hypothetical protein MTO96_022162 [Rhipicephalus appendiculatus]